MTVTMKAVIYARYSSDQQDDATIETQIRECQAKAKILNAIVVREYCDVAQSGRSTDDRAQFKQMLQDAKLKGFSLVIVRKFDRFARNVVDARLTEQHLEKYGVRLISCHESFDESTAGWFSKQMVHLVNEWYSRNLATETISGMETNTRKGFRCGGSAPYGYKNVKVIDQATGKTRTKLAIEPHEAEATRLIFQRYSDGIGLNLIIKELVKKGFNPRRSKAWSKSQLSQMLENETYTGVLTWRKTPNPETWVRVDGAAPEVISPDLWKKTKARKELTSELRPRSKGSVSHPLAGIVKCAECGAAYVIHSKHSERWRLHCSGHIRKTGCTNQKSLFEDHLVEEVRTALLKNIFTDKNIRTALMQIRKELGDDQSANKTSLKKIRAKISEIESRQVALVSEMAGGLIPREIVYRTITETESEKAGLLARATELDQEINRASGLKISERDVSEFISITHCALETKNYSSLKVQLQWLKVSILIGKNETKIQIAPSLFGSDIVLTGAGDGKLNNTIPALWRILCVNTRLPRESQASN